MPLLIYTDQTSPRLHYIFSILLHAIGIQFTITTDKSFYIGSLVPKFNYSQQSIAEDDYWIEPAPLLFEKDIHIQQIECFLWRDTKAFFKSCVGDLPFDLFAASFYLLTRYEEYLPHKQDTYGRYSHENSIAYKESFLQLPLVNIWLMEFRTLLQQKFPALSFQPQTFKFIPTYDIDIAWSYRNKGWLRNAGGMLKSIMNGEWRMVKERVKVLSGKQPDPFDVYDRLCELHTAHKLAPVYFFLLAKENKLYDKNILPFNMELRELVSDHCLKYEVGIHPSWQSGNSELLLAQETNELQEITNKHVANSRQHYIRMSLPATYQQLLNAGISNDYSMGYGSINGFRGSYCLPYQWYDLSNEKVTNLTLHPFCYMEANSYYEQHYSLQQAEEELEHYLAIVQKINGTLITIFHNHILGNKLLFTGWMEMYEKFLSKAVANV